MSIMTTSMHFPLHFALMLPIYQFLYQKSMKKNKTSFILVSIHVIKTSLLYLATLYCSSLYGPVPQYKKKVNKKNSIIAMAGH